MAGRPTSRNDERLEPGNPQGRHPVCLLAQLRQRRMYGFEIIRVLRERSNGFFDLKEGTLYPALHRLEQRGLFHPARSGLAVR